MKSIDEGKGQKKKDLQAVAQTVITKTTTAKTRATKTRTTKALDSQATKIHSKDKRASAAAEAVSSIGAAPSYLPRSKDFLQYKDSNGYHLHFWAASEPFCGSTLRLYPSIKGENVSGVIRFRNSHGECFNECTVATRNGKPLALYLDSLLEYCETESGFRHCHIEVISKEQCRGHVQVSTNVRSAFLQPLHSVSEVAHRSFPLSFSSTTSHVVMLVNPSDRQISVRSRLYLSSRSPEEAFVLGPYATVLFSPQVMFYSVFEQCMGHLQVDGSQETEQGYLRFATRSKSPFGVQILEEFSHASGERTVGVIT